MNDNTTEDRLANLEKRVGILEELLAKPNCEGKPPTDKRVSPREFLDLKKTSTAIEKTLALAYYLEHIEQMSSFNVSDLSNAFRMAKEPLPVNLNDMINKNISKGYLMDFQKPKDSKKAWTLTATGEKFVEGS